MANSLDYDGFGFKAFSFRRMSFIFYLLPLILALLFTPAVQAQDEEPPNAAPPPVKVISKEEKTALDAYVAKHNRANSLIVNIESGPGIAALDEILAVEGLDAVLIGPHDLSCSLGQPERYDRVYIDTPPALSTGRC